VPNDLEGEMTMLHKLRIALAATLLALAAVTAVDSASAGDFGSLYYGIFVESFLYGSP
jgi:hypothetical protein